MSELREERVTIGGEVLIGATITCQDKTKKSPAVILIMGTGKTDRDGNQKGFSTDFYKNLAGFFAENGYACIRYDKRGTYETKGDYNTAGLRDLTDDAIAVTRYAKELPYIDSEKIVVCGHSEGAMIATLLSERENVAGLLLLGGAAMSMRDALLYQNQVLAREAQGKKGLLGIILRKQARSDKADKAVEALFQKSKDAKKDRFFWNGAMMNTKWLQEHANLTAEDYVEILRRFNRPVLAITGTADLSADYRSLERLKELPFVQTYAPEDVNHMLRMIDDDNSMLTVQKQYKRLARQQVHEETKQKMAEWLAKAFLGVNL